MALHDIADQVSTNRTSRRPQRQEHAAELMTAAQRQILGERDADIIRDREPIIPASLAADQEIASPPIEIVESEAGDLDRP
jgi:hypothetical protein